MLYDELIADWHAKLVHVLLTKGSAQQDGSYYSAALDEDTYVIVTNYATASSHADYSINSADRSQRTSLEVGNPIITVEFRHVATDEVKRGFILCQPKNVRENSILGAWLINKRASSFASDEFVIFNTSDGTEVNGVEARNSPLRNLIDNID
jgi:hypothetical protein